MAKRIVEETLANGEKRYCVQSNTLFGIPCWWSTMTILTDGGVSTSAEFSSLEAARNFLGKSIAFVNQFHKVIELHLGGESLTIR